MAHCLPRCSRDGLENVNKNDLNRFTNSLNNVLSDEKGRNLFKKFLRDLESGNSDAVLLWEECERVVNSDESDEALLNHADRLRNKARSVEFLDSQIMRLLKQITDKKNKKNKHDIVNGIKKLQDNIVEGLREDYVEFRSYCLETLLPQIANCVCDDN